MYGVILLLEKFVFYYILIRVTIFLNLFTQLYICKLFTELFLCKLFTQLYLCKDFYVIVRMCVLCALLCFYVIFIVESILTNKSQWPGLFTVIFTTKILFTMLLNYYMNYIYIILCSRQSMCCFDRWQINAILNNFEHHPKSWNIIFTYIEMYHAQ